MNFKFKKRGIEPATALSQADTKDLKSLKPVNVDAQIVVDRNRWFLITVILGVIALVAMMHAISSSKRAADNFQLAYVKMHPNGMWDVEFFDETRGVEFFPTTIDYLLRLWIQRRYSEISHSIQADYGYVKLFMSPALQGEFVNELNAPKKAAEIMSCMGCPQRQADVRNIDHYDSDKTTFGREEGTLYRTNVFVKLKTYNDDGAVLNVSRKIVSLHWRLKSKDEIEANRNILEYNPVGLEIMKYYMLDDPSDKEVEDVDA